MRNDLDSIRAELVTLKADMITKDHFEKHGPIWIDMHSTVKVNLLIICFLTGSLIP